jgi:hypothetical protein
MESDVPLMSDVEHFKGAKVNWLEGCCVQLNDFALFNLHALPWLNDAFEVFKDSPFHLSLFIEVANPLVGDFCHLVDSLFAVERHLVPCSQRVGVVVVRHGLWFVSVFEWNERNSPTQL